MPDIDPMLEKQDAEQVSEGVDDAMQQYPSPTANEQDNGPFYHSNPHSDQPDESGLGQQHEGQEHLEGSPTPHQQRAFSGPISTEELQLAAQLSQGLAGHNMPMDDDHMMDPNQDPSLEQVMEHHEMEQHEMAQQEHDLAQHEHDFQSHEHHEQQHEDQTHQDQLQQHEVQHEVQHQQEEPYGPPQLQQQDDQPLQHHETQQQQEEPYGPPQPQYIPEQQQQQHHEAQQQQQQPQIQPHLQPAASMNHIGPHFQQTPADNTPPRKRSKVSRACDECRRKKVKCDAPSETGEEPCSNCRRSNIHCLFSRIPQKRGPSKGYIKELADRIHHIEGKLASEGGNVDSLTELLSGVRRESSSDGFTPTCQSDENSRKRPFSSISGADLGTPSRQQTWGSEPRPIQPYQSPMTIKQPYSVNGLAPTPVAPKDSDSLSQPTPMMDGLSVDLNGIGHGRDVDEGAFNGYLGIIHPCFPVLANSKSRVDALLAQCPLLLREAFVEAFHGSMQSFPSFNGPYTGGDLVSAADLISKYEGMPTQRTYATNLVRLQTLILIAISTDNFGPASLKGEHGGAEKSSILYRAIGLAIAMKLHTIHFDASVINELDLDSDENIAIRAWWTLIMLDRWNAISTASTLSIPNDSVVILPGLSILLGENVYHLVRLSNILGHFSPVALAPPKAMTHESGAAPLLSSFFNLSMELFREVLPPSITPASHPILHLAYWHCRLLAYLFQTNAQSSDILWPCKESVSLLTANSQLITPLNHHFFSLTTLSLLELAKVEATKDEATTCLKELLDNNLAPSTWDAIIRDRIAEHVRPTTAQASMAAAASQSLQHLADLATATELDALKSDKASELITLRTSDNYDDVGFDPRPLLRSGYLTVFSEPPPFTSR